MCNARWHAFIFYREENQYKIIEKSFEDAIFKHYGLYPLSDEEKYLVKKVDEAVLWYEFKMIHTIPISFSKTPHLASTPRVDYCDMRAVEQLLLREINGFEKAKKTA